MFAARRARASPLLLLVVLRLGLEDERLARGQRGGVVGLGGQRRVVDRWKRLGLLELLVEARLALLLRRRRRVGDEPADQADRADRVVVGRDDPVDEVRVAVRIGHRDDRDLEAARLGDGDRLAMRVDDEDRPGQPAHLADAAEGRVELVDLLGELRGLLLREALELAGVASGLEGLEALDAALDRREVGEHPAQPTRIDVMLAASAERPPPSASCACFFVPTKRTLSPRRTVSRMNSRAASRRLTVWARSMMWIPLRSAKMYSRIFGFQRRVWCPKWTPASSSCFMLVAATCEPPVVPPPGIGSPVDPRDFVEGTADQRDPPGVCDGTALAGSRAVRL